MRSKLRWPTDAPSAAAAALRAVKPRELPSCKTATSGGGGAALHGELLDEGLLLEDRDLTGLGFEGQNARGRNHAGARLRLQVLHERIERGLGNDPTLQAIPGAPIVAQQSGDRLRIDLIVGRLQRPLGLVPVGLGRQGQGFRARARGHAGLGRRPQQVLSRLADGALVVGLEAVEDRERLVVGGGLGRGGLARGQSEQGQQGGDLHKGLVTEPGRQVSKGTRKKVKKGRGKTHARNRALACSALAIQPRWAGEHSTARFCSPRPPAR